MLKKLEKFSLPEIEEKTLKFWHAHDVFEKSTERTKGKRKFVFYEGPPTANGRPGIHHVLARAFKDIVCRYKTMRGFYVPRKSGWDTHGLPVELEVEKQLGLKSKKDIERFGIAEFNQKCKESVWKYKDEWEKLTERIGFWLDLKNPYITYENYYIETLWWIISQIHKRGLLYKGHKVVPWCTRCGTALSSHEMALGYKEVEDTSVYVKFRLKKWQRIAIRQAQGKATTFVTNSKSYIVSWTTTPWTLPGNVALAIEANLDYVIVQTQYGEIRPPTMKNSKFEIRNSKLTNQSSHIEYLILAKERVSVLDQPHEIIGTCKGKDLVGLRYEPLFDIKSLQQKNSYKVYAADFVNTEEGTGVVHTAVMYGEEDYELGTKVGLPKYHTVDESGKFTKDVPGLHGLYVKDKKTEEKIIDYLKSNNLNLKSEIHKHDYPFCWRCDTPLLYYARESWFIAMSKLRKALLEENEKINWIPNHLKYGRFGEWLKEVKDWAISRERYWGTPLPIWQHTQTYAESRADARRKFKNKLRRCDNTVVVGGIEELHALQGGSKNKYILMRHGESTKNRKGISNTSVTQSRNYPLTLKGRVQAEKAGRVLKSRKVNFIFASDFFRAQETAKIIAAMLEGKVIFDKRLREIDIGVFDGKPAKEYGGYFTSDHEKFEKAPPQGETLREVARRSLGFVSELEKKYKNKTILIVGHEHPLWMLEAVMRGWSEEEALRQRQKKQGDFIEEGEVRETPFLKLPRNEFGFGDLHRPYIDAIRFRCSKCGKSMQWVKDVVDVWFDSGAMPLASAHYPFAFARNPKSEILNPKSCIDYPADYICEAVDQTRGWFYTLLAVATLLNQEAPYKNVISTGHVLDKNGEKMSKSKGNVVDPWEMIQKYGADVIRWYFYTVNPPGESKRFDETDLTKVSRQFFNLVYNSFVFYDLYAVKDLRFKIKDLRREHVLDRWVVARLEETTLNASKHLDSYKVNEAARAIEEFVGDLSRWYIRRSRRRFQKPESQKDYEAASQTLTYVLLELSKILGPLTPFFAEALYVSLKFPISNPPAGGQFPISVHLNDWPKAARRLIDKKLLSVMAEVRRLASLALAKRAEAGIKVRQPLAMLRIRNKELGIRKDLLEILADEVNVKEVVFDLKMKDDVRLDTTITHELKEEGWLREFIRIVQDLRQDAKLKPQEKVVLMLEAGDELQDLIQKQEYFVKREVGVSHIEYMRHKKFDIELETKFEERHLWLALRKPR